MSDPAYRRTRGPLSEDEKALAGGLCCVRLPPLLTGLGLGLKDWWAWDGRRSRHGQAAVIIEMTALGGAFLVLFSLMPGPPN